MIPEFSYPSWEAETFLKKLAERGAEADENIKTQVLEILNNVRSRGDEALLEYTRRFDFPDATLESLEVKESEIENAYRAVSSEFLEILRKAIKNIRSFHENQKEKSWFQIDEKGRLVGQLVRPVQSAGLYVPGGTGGNTPLISTLLMTAIPARVAEVPDIALVSPPRKDGSLHPGLLVAAKEVDVNRIYKVGSAWAIGALAYGTETIKPVNVIVGPGNIYVTTAKKIVAGLVGIDILAGPSEILIVADETAFPSYVAADLLSQAEHDTMASSILITTSKQISEKVRSALEDQLKLLGRKKVALASLKSYGASFIVSSTDQAVELVNRIAPEHLEIHVKDPWSFLGRIKNAGAVFLGSYTPEAVGDYFAGPNHVLPTSATARYASALNVGVFFKRISVLQYTKEALDEDVKTIAEMARWEGLEAHARSVLIRRGSE